MITQARLKELLHYDPETGVFTWRVSRGLAVKGGTAGCLCKESGRILIGVDGKLHLAHRLVWVYVFGCIPDSGIDHINGCPSDNRLNNLREANQSQNMQNIKNPPKHNTSGALGVCWHKGARKWMSVIQLNGSQKYLGLFDSRELAHQAYLAAKRELHPFQTLVGA